MESEVQWLTLLSFGTRRAGGGAERQAEAAAGPEPAQPARLRQAQVC